MNVYPGRNGRMPDARPANSHGLFRRDFLRHRSWLSRWLVVFAGEVGDRACLISREPLLLAQPLQRGAALEDRDEQGEDDSEY